MTLMRIKHEGIDLLADIVNNLARKVNDNFFARAACYSYQISNSNSAGRPHSISVFRFDVSKDNADEKCTTQERHVVLNLSILYFDNACVVISGTASSIL